MFDLDMMFGDVMLEGNEKSEKLTKQGGGLFNQQLFDRVKVTQIISYKA